jgi:hypothetical protein
MPAGTSSPTRATTPGRCSIISDIRTSSARYVYTEVRQLGGYFVYDSPPSGELSSVGALGRIVTGGPTSGAVKVVCHGLQDDAGSIRSAESYEPTQEGIAGDFDLLGGMHAATMPRPAAAVVLHIECKHLETETRHVAGFVVY